MGSLSALPGTSPGGRGSRDRGFSPTGGDVTPVTEGEPASAAWTRFAPHGGATTSVCRVGSLSALPGTFAHHADSLPLGEMSLQRQRGNRRRQLGRVLHLMAAQQHLCVRVGSLSALPGTSPGGRGSRTRAFSPTGGDVASATEGEPASSAWTRFAPHGGATTSMCSRGFPLRPAGHLSRGEVRAIGDFLPTGRDGLRPVAGDRGGTGESQPGRVLHLMAAQQHLCVRVASLSALPGTFAHHAHSPPPGEMSLQRQRGNRQPQLGRVLHLMAAQQHLCVRVGSLSALPGTSRGGRGPRTRGFSPFGGDVTPVTEGEPASSAWTRFAPHGGATTSMCSRGFPLRPAGHLWGFAQHAHSLPLGEMSLQRQRGNRQPQPGRVLHLVDDIDVFAWLPSPPCRAPSPGAFVIGQPRNFFPESAWSRRIWAGANRSPWAAASRSSLVTTSSAPRRSTSMNGPPVNGGKPSPKIAPMSPSRADRRMPSSQAQRRLVDHRQRPDDPGSGHGGIDVAGLAAQHVVDRSRRRPPFLPSS